MQAISCGGINGVFGCGNPSQRWLSFVIDMKGLELLVVETSHMQGRRHHAEDSS